MKRRVDYIFQMLPSDRRNEHNEKENDGFIANSQQNKYHELQITQTNQLTDVEMKNLQSDESLSFIENTPEKETKNTRTLNNNPIELPKMGYNEMNADQASNSPKLLNCSENLTEVVYRII
ncbi:unnamed protein product [Parnassius apollo]|uniref:(apollo) hypothetical protein n=1 Tax=Parnassius apollo TaxID=110799 RepID=A0A8S3W0T6_PARAO|nr:unnamed protein product [Parnassius apollo]